ncbi:MAG: hypothetical protein ACYC1D_01005 [Acidimicrobiales bacterium]
MRWISDAAWKRLLWTIRLGGMSNTAITTPTLRRRSIAIPGHVTARHRRTTMHLARDWPWRQGFLNALGAPRSLGGAPHLNRPASRRRRQQTPSVDPG